MHIIFYCYLNSICNTDILIQKIFIASSIALHVRSKICKKRERRRKKECAKDEDYHSSFRDNTLLECTRSQRIAQQDSSIFEASSVSLYFSSFFIAFFRWRRGIRWSQGLIALSLRSIRATFLSLSYYKMWKFIALNLSVPLKLSRCFFSNFKYNFSNMIIIVSICVIILSYYMFVKYLLLKSA